MGANIARNLERAGTGAPALAAQIDAAAGRVRQALDGMDELTRSSLARAASLADDERRGYFGKATAQLEALYREIDGATALATGLLEREVARIGREQIALWSVLVVLALAALALGVLIARSIAGPLVEAAALARRVAESDLSARRAAGARRDGPAAGVAEPDERRTERHGASGAGRGRRDRRRGGRDRRRQP